MTCILSVIFWCVFDTNVQCRPFIGNPKVGVLKMEPKVIEPKPEEKIYEALGDENDGEIIERLNENDGGQEAGKDVE